MRNPLFQICRASLWAIIACFCAPIPASAQMLGAAGKVEIEVEYFGVGNTARPGDWAGIRVVLKDFGDQTRDVAIRLFLTDPDGDTALHQREVILTPGVSLAAWLYASLPWSLGPEDSFTITVHEADMSGTSPIIGRQIGYERISPQRVVEPSQPMIAVVGRETFGLLQYEERGSGQSDQSVTSHELTRIVHSIDPAINGLPTEWLGLAPFEALVWTETDPGVLQRGLAAEAIREWVLRGGHLVVVMEPVADGWFASSNPLADLMPDVRAIRHEEASLEPYRWLLTKPRAQFDSIALPERSVIHSFSTNKGAEKTDAIALVNGPEGTVIVRKLAGAGMVTVIGLDLSAGGIDRRGLIRADAFWNRILGKRADALTAAETDSVARTGISRTIRGFGNTVADRYISSEINLRGTVSVGVLFGLGLFSVYWLVAGFGSFAGLKSRKLEHHAWVVFVLVTVLFTGIAWAGARFLKPTDVRAQHVTFLDHVYGQPLDRARSFASIMLPEYGTQRVSIAPQTEDEPWRQALSTWLDPQDAGTQRSFPDARQYTVPSHRPDEMVVPSRQTVKQFRADWLGAPVWTMPIPQGEHGYPRVFRNGELSGVLAHDLPAALKYVVITHVRGQRSIADVHALWEKDKTGVLMCDSVAIKLREPWEPGVPLDLAQQFKDATLANASGDIYLSSIVPRRRAGQLVGVTSGSVADYSLINFMNVIGQPEYAREDFNQSVHALVSRQMTHTMDISKWLTQPCIIITGHVEDAPCPVPFQLDGRTVPSTGRTIVRWMFPLDGEPLRVR